MLLEYKMSLSRNTFTPMPQIIEVSCGKPTSSAETTAPQLKLGTCRSFNQSFQLGINFQFGIQHHAEVMSGNKT